MIFCMNNSEIVKLLNKIYLIKYEVDKRSMEANDLSVDKNGKIEFLRKVNEKMKQEFNDVSGQKKCWRSNK